ncbi:hypothetical protein ZYGR_0N05960 [Zygosaccharomyces rouxii]|uniref:ZYRO0D13970p n=2 Tax=Zygosaccharomyces rouxii TaxID=4956 RepID=C5DWD7_ZYGRC|nr:uncharacterized protein ZYRO0D13970g [Zygosaccharomyces rouxii]KAH9201016.1 triose-phosphate transporter family-domain-containing protein [Zygosaccharomyces rouxii]GAV49189.1 hypothetical protein ZYGR_0N05960 [Zygosaccharomyces rouxii]CAR28106.1 ZYRO0D13970p [Zygosaccharomyces rouxii]
MRQRLVLFILGWYLTSITLSLYNKWMFDPHKGLQVVCPITVTSFHQFILWFLSFIYVKYRGWRKKDNDPNPLIRQIPRMDWKFYMRYLVPTAIASAGDIGFGNVSFKFVTLAIYTIIKSSSIAFVLLFGCLFKLEQFHWKLVVIVAVMFFGVLMMVYEPNNEKVEEDRILILFGSLLVLMSSCLSGMRWVFTQLILRKSPQEPEVEQREQTTEETVAVTTKREKPHPVQTIYQLAPIMGFTLFFTALIIERPFPSFLKSNLFTQDGNHQYTFGSITKGILLLTFPGFEVFLMTICEFGILQTAHVLTLSVAGIIKELLTILCSVIFLNERLSGFHNWAGMTIVLLDVAYYNYFRYTQDEKLNDPQKDLENHTIDERNDSDSGTVLLSQLKQPSLESVSYELAHVNNNPS